MGNFIGKLDNRNWKFSDAQSKLQRIIKLLNVVDDIMMFPDMLFLKLLENENIIGI